MNYTIKAVTNDVTVTYNTNQTETISSTSGMNCVELLSLSYIDGGSNVLTSIENGDLKVYYNLVECDECKIIIGSLVTYFTNNYITHNKKLNNDLDLL